VRFVADESCDFAVVRALRAASHDVIAIVESSSRSEDDEVLRLARDSERILLTEDKDFGELVYARALANCGVILFRFPARARDKIADAALNVVNKMNDRLSSRFTVVQPGRIRASTSGRSA
jgi:predicted nuclease of predicted toxin-antitoxin system